MIFVSEERDKNEKNKNKLYIRPQEFPRHNLSSNLMILQSVFIKSY